MPDVKKVVSTSFGLVAGSPTASDACGPAAGYGSLWELSWELDLVGVVVRRAALRRASAWLGLGFG